MRVLRRGVQLLLAIASSLLGACSDQGDETSLASMRASGAGGSGRAGGGSGGAGGGVEAGTPGPGEVGGAGGDACGYGTGRGGLTYSTRVTEPTDHLLTDAQRQETGEVYCVSAAPPSRGARSVVLVPGLGLGHYVYLTTPDRRHGWASLFAAAGATAHVFNPAANVTTAADPAAPGNLSLWMEDDFWSRWGFGPAPRTPYADVRFPVEHVDDFIEHLPAYRAAGGGTSASPAAVAELTEVLEHVGPSVLLVHSAAGAVGFAAARARPELMTALVVVEPTGCPVQSSEIAPLPFLAIYGDYIDSRRQTGRLQSCQTTRNLVAAAGYPAEFISYPAIDVRGNTHLLMQDDNSADIFADVLAWLEQTVWN